MLLVGAGLRLWLGSPPAWQSYFMLDRLIDPGSEGGGNAGVVLGSSVLIWAV